MIAVALSGFTPDLDSFLIASLTARANLQYSFSIYSFEYNCLLGRGDQIILAFLFLNLFSLTRENPSDNVLGMPAITMKRIGIALRYGLVRASFFAISIGKLIRRNSLVSSVLNKYSRRVNLPDLIEALKRRATKL